MKDFREPPHPGPRIEYGAGFLPRGEKGEYRSPLIPAFSHEGRRGESEPPHPGLLPQGEKGRIGAPSSRPSPTRGEGANRSPLIPAFSRKGRRGSIGAPSSRPSPTRGEGEIGAPSSRPSPTRGEGANRSPLIPAFSHEGRRGESEPPHPGLLPQGEKGKYRSPLIPAPVSSTGQAFSRERRRRNRSPLIPAFSREGKRRNRSPLIPAFSHEGRRGESEPPHPGPRIEYGAGFLPQGEKGKIWAKLLLAAAVVGLWLALGTAGVGGQTVVDDHGDTYDTATDVALGSSVAVRIDPGHDRDVFRVDLSGEPGDTDLWMYATSDEYDTFAGLYDSDGALVELNDDGFFLGDFRSFSIRSVVPPGVYYLIVVSYAGEPGGFTLHTQAVTAPGNSVETALPLSLDSAVGGVIDSPDDADYFKLEITETTHVIADATTVDLAPIDVGLLDADGGDLSVNKSIIAVRAFGIPFPIGVRMGESFEPGTYYLRVALPEIEPDDGSLISSPPDDGAFPFRPVTYSLFFTEDTDYTKLLEECAAATRGLNDPEISDPLFACQWHLASDEWMNVNAGPAWAAGVMGEGVGVAVVDDGMYHEHEDLRDNVAAELNRDYTESGDIYSPFDHHGTHVSGMIAARDNDVGVRGVAPRATLYGYNFLAPGAATLLSLLDAMTANHEVTGVSNNSWGPADGPDLDPDPPFWTQAIDLGITEGNDGKGVFYVFAAGNGHLLGDDSNYDGVANYFGVTAVCSVHSGGSRAGYSEMGANLWVCGPSNDRPRSLGGVRGILTTENSDRYYNDFGGTSAAAPIVSGVAALMRSANPELTWRDLKLILAATAQKNDPSSSGWEDGARKYRSGSDADRYHFNHEYGFGLADAGAAVDLAREWTNLPPLMKASTESEWESVEVPDAPDAGDPATVERTVTIGTSIGFTEFVEVTLAFEHDSFRDLEVELVSPSGAVSRLSTPYDTYTGLFFFEPFVPLYGEYRFGSARHLGEDPNGEWTLRVADHIPAVDGILDGMAITVYGHERAPGAPDAIGASQKVEGQSLFVSWRSPDDTGDSAISSYDLRHVPTDSDETVDSNWTVVEGVWSADAGGELEHTLTGLTDGTQYDVQVRAVNDSGGGLWSNTVTGTPRTNPCVGGGAVADGADNPDLARDCEGLLEARDALAGTATLNWSSDRPITEWDGIRGGEYPSLEGTPPRVTRLYLHGRGMDGTIPVDLANVKELKWLYLHRNELTGEIPGDVASLPALERLYVYDNELTGGVPVGSGSLRRLFAQRNNLSGTIPPELGLMSGLEWLSLYDNNLSGVIPSELGGLSSLERLHLQRNNLSGAIPSELGGLSGLTHVLLNGNNLSGEIPSALGGLTSLEWLSLQDNRLSGEIPSALGGLSSLDRLHLQGNRLTGAIPPELGDLAALTNLWLNDNRLSGSIPSALDGLANLVRWRLGGNGFTGCVPAGLAAVADSDLASLGLGTCPAP